MASSASAQTTVSEVLTLLGSTAQTGTVVAAYVDVYGNIYAAATGGTSILEIPANGGTPVVLASGLAPVLQGIAADSAGNVYYSQVNATTLQVLSPSGTTTAFGSGLKNVFDLAVDSAQNVYAADLLSAKVWKIPTTGATAGTPVALPFTSLASIHGVAVDAAGDVYVTGSGSVGIPLSVLPVSGTGYGTQVNYALTGPESATNSTQVALNAAYGIAVDPAGNVYIDDQSGTDTAATGRILEFPVPITTNGGIPLPQALGGSGKTVSLTPRGELIVDNSGGVYSMSPLVATNFTGNFYGVPVGSTSKTAILTFTVASATTLAKVPVLFSSNNAGTVQFKDAGADTCVASKALVAGASCVVNVTFAPTITGPVTGQVSLVDSLGNVTNVMVTGVGDAPVVAFAPGTQSTAVSGLTAPAGVAVDLAGSIYTADPSSGKVTKTTSAGVTSTLAFTGLVRPTGVAVDGAGSVYVSDASANSIVKLTTANVQSTVPVSGTGVTGLNAPKGIALDTLNNLYIADSGNARVVGVSNSGSASVVAFTGLMSPSFVAVDAQGNVYVSDTGKVYEKPVGSAQVAVAPSALSAAAGIATSTSGSLAIADSGTGNILVVPPTGSSISFAAALKTASGIAVAPTGSLYAADAGAGVVTLLDRTKDTITFPPTASGGTSAPLTAAVQNAGNAALTVSALAASSGFTLLSPAAGTDCTATTSLAVGASCNVDVEFTPSTLGAVSGTATLTDNVANVLTSTQSVTLVGTGIKATSTALAITTPTSGSPVYGQAVTVTATVAPTASTGVPTGSVTFALDGGTPSTGVTLSGSSQAAFTFNNLSAGSHTVVAVYSGDTAFATSTSTKFTFSVAKAVLTVTAVSQTRMYNVANAPLTFTYGTFQYSDTSAVVTGTPVLATTATTTSVPGNYPITVDVSGLSAANYTFTAVPGSITVTQASNVITFAALPNVTYGVGAINLTATASSGLAVTYSIVSGAGVATVTNGAAPFLTITGTGSVTVAADQPGNANTAAATQVRVTFTVNKAVLTVTADNKSKQQGAANPALTFTASGFVYSDTQTSVLGATAPALATAATTASPTGTYPITITQGTLAATNYTFSLVQGTLTVTGNTAQTITFGAIANTTYGASAIALTATASSSLPVTYTLTGPGTLSGSTVVITGAGQVCVTAAQAGNSTYAAATSVQECFTVVPAVLTVTTANVSRQINTPNPAFAPVITGFVNGDSASVVNGAPSIITLATTASPVGNYAITVTAGNLQALNYTFAFVNATLTVTATPQTITFPALPSVTYGVSPITLMATASSGLAVTYTATGPATVSGSVLTITGAGQVCVTAAQAGNATYAAATAVQQCTTVAKAPLTVTASDASITYGAAIPTTFAYTITGFVNSDTVSVVSGAPAITTTATSTSAGGTYPITPALGTLAATNYTFTTFVPGTLTIGQAAQTITFAALPSVLQSAKMVTLAATASSGLPVTFSLGTGSVGATISGNVLTLTGPGTVVVVASQAGNSSYSAATPVTQSFIVTGTTSTALTVSVATQYAGTSVTFTAKVTGDVTGVVSSGTVSFYANTTLIGTVTLTTGSSTATLTTAVIPAGNDSITAVYSGDTLNSPSTSAAVTLLIIASDVEVSASATNMTIPVGGSGSTTFTVTPVGGYSYLLKMSCPNIPSNLTCTFSPNALSFYPGTKATSNPQTTVLTITANALNATNRPFSLQSKASEVALAAIFGMPLLSLALFAGGRRKRSLLQTSSLLLLLLLVGSGLGSLVGCGSGPGTEHSNTYSVPATFDDGTGTTHVVAITVTVTQ